MKLERLILYSDQINKINKYLNVISLFQGSILVAIDGEIILADGYGYADEAAQIMNTENTIFEIGSITKQFTAAAIMQLAEQGKLSVDDTIDKTVLDGGMENGTTE